MQTDLAPRSSEIDRVEPRARDIALAVTGLALIPYLVVLIGRWGRRYLPVQDLAVIDLRARDVFSLHPPLTGSWSRIGFAHPGPLFTWLMGIPSFLTGGAPWSLIAGAAVLHAIAIVVAARLAWARGRLPMVLLVMVAMSLIALGLTSWGLIAPWNIDVALPYFPVFLLLAWSVGLGEYRRLPWLAVVTTFLVQAHVGYAPVVLLPLLWVGWHFVADWRSAPELRHHQRRALVWSAVWVAILWLPAVVDELFVTGNLGAIRRAFFESDKAPAGLVVALRWFADEFRWVPRWLGAHPRSMSVSLWAMPASLVWLAIPVLIIAAAAFATRRRGTRAAQRLVTLMALTTVGSVAAMSRITGDQFPYLFEWRLVVAVFIVFAGAVAVAPWFSAHRSLRRAGLVALIVIVVVVNGVLLRRVVTFPQDLSESTPTVTRLVDVVLPVAPHRPFTVRAEGPESVGVTSAIVNELDRRGVPVRTDPWLDFEYGPQRSAPVADSSELWLVVEDGWLGSRLREISGGNVIASTHPLGAADERELAQLQRAMWSQLQRVGAADKIRALDSGLFGLAVADVHGIDHGAAARIAALNSRARTASPCRCLVVAFPTDHATLRRIHRFENPPPVRSGRSGPAAR